MPSTQLVISMHAALKLVTIYKNGKKNNADITQGKQQNPYVISVFDRTIVTKKLFDSA